MSKLWLQRISLIVADLLSLYLSFIFVVLILQVSRPGVDHIRFDYVGVAKIAALLLIVVFWYQEQYIKRRPSWEELRLLYKTIFIFAALHLGASYLVSHSVVKTLNVLFWCMLLLVLPLLRYITKRLLMRIGVWQRDIYIIGVGDNAYQTSELLRSSKILGYRIIGFVDISGKDAVNSALHKMNVIILTCHDFLEKTPHDAEIVFALSTEGLLSNLNKINLLQSRYQFVSIVPDLLGLPLYGVELEHFFGSDQLFLRLENNLGQKFNRITKRLIDILLSFVGIVVLLPVFITIAGIIKTTSGGNIFYQHRRVGRDGEYFYCTKFQTMYQNSAELLEELLANDAKARDEWQHDFKLKNDPRVTKVGGFLRKTSLDELPQLFNVLIGEMSLIGPRPIVTDEISRYADDFYYYKLVRPGITGLWQISGRNDVDYTNRVRLDVWYVKNWSLWYDFVILFRTVFVVFSRSGAY